MGEKTIKVKVPNTSPDTWIDSTIDTDDKRFQVVDEESGEVLGVFRYTRHGLNDDGKSVSCEFVANLTDLESAFCEDTAARNAEGERQLHDLVCAILRGPVVTGTMSGVVDTAREMLAEIKGEKDE